VGRNSTPQKINFATIDKSIVTKESAFQPFLAAISHPVRAKVKVIHKGDDRVKIAALTCGKTRGNCG
jgi:hypothetical protein